MPIDLSSLRRLAFIRYQHQVGSQQAKLPEPMSSISILTLHDAVEGFLVLAAEHLDVQPPQFEKYWDVLSGKLPDGVNLAGAEAGKRLNRLRVLVKHHGGTASQGDIEQAELNVSTFMSANCQIVFGVDYDRVSLAEVIPQSGVRELVQAADEDADCGEFKDAMVNLTQAFDALFRPHRWLGGLTWGKPSSPLHFGPNIPHDPFSDHRIAFLPREEREAAEKLAAVTATVRELQPAARMTAIGIDYAAYSRFLALTPSIRLSWHPIKRTHIQVFLASPRYDPRRSDYEFCQQFVVSASLRLAQVAAHIEDVPWAPRPDTYEQEVEIARVPLPSEHDEGEGDDS